MSGDERDERTEDERDAWCREHDQYDDCSPRPVREPVRMDIPPSVRTVRALRNRRKVIE